MDIQCGRATHSLSFPSHEGGVSRVEMEANEGAEGPEHARTEMCKGSESVIMCAEGCGPMVACDGLVCGGGLQMCHGVVLSCWAQAGAVSVTDEEFRALLGRMLPLLQRAVVSTAEPWEGRWIARAMGVGDGSEGRGFYEVVAFFRGAVQLSAVPWETCRADGHGWTFRVEEGAGSRSCCRRMLKQRLDRAEQDNPSGRWICTDSGTVQSVSLAPCNGDTGEDPSATGVQADAEIAKMLQSVDRKPRNAGE